MTLGDIIKKYRQTHGISMDVFSEKSGISKAYISLLEKNKHPKTGKAIAPSIQCIKQAADGMNMDFNLLFSQIDSDVTLDEEVENRTKAPQLEDVYLSFAKQAQDEEIPPEDIILAIDMIKKLRGEK
ncbi:MAG: helix-turn-helix transcriptional regulator [Clostridiales Family XIII bacterium]|nr:helix-turn-helix domain-containing protein [Clostridia bacterium]MDY3011459.1 helix-turn-helix transcriptional regulator [Clostridiales Family XIII bacterium]